MINYTDLGNTAVKIEPEYQPQYEPQYTPPHRQPEKQPKRRLVDKEIPFGLKVKMITRVLLVTALALFMLARFATVSIANIGLNEAKKTVKEQQAVISDLESKLSSSMQLDTIEEKAIGLGMSFPGNDQMVHVQLVPYDDLVKQNSSNLEKSPRSILSQIID